MAVTALGLWNPWGYLTRSHAVGLFSSTSELLATVTLEGEKVPGEVPPGTFGPDDFRYLPLAAPVVLAPGTYRIGAHWVGRSDPMESWDVLGSRVDPLGASGYVTYVGPRFLAGPALTDPTGVSTLAGGVFGPNFLFQAVPEPSTLALAVTGLLVLGVGALRRKRWRAFSRRSP